MSIRLPTFSILLKPFPELIESPTKPSTQSPSESPTQSLADTLVPSLTESSTSALIQSPSNESDESDEESSTDTPVDYAAYIQSITEITPSNEQELRSYHHDLSQHDTVSVYEYPWLDKIWIVPSTGDSTLDRQIPKTVADRELHVMPVIDVPLGDITLADPFPGTPIGPRSSYDRLSNAVKAKLKEMFPALMGVKILRCGVFTLLFPSKEEVDNALAAPRPETIGGLFCNFGICPESGEAARNKDTN